MKCKLKILLQIAEMSSSSYHDARKRAYKEYPPELIDAIMSIRDENPDYGYRRANRRFTTNRPYQKVPTDVTEVLWGSGTMAERAYFTAYINVYSAEILTWNIDLQPTVEFVTKPLDELLKNRSE